MDALTAGQPVTYTNRKGRVTYGIVSAVLHDEPAGHIEWIDGPMVWDMVTMRASELEPLDLETLPACATCGELAHVPTRHAYAPAS